MSMLPTLAFVLAILTAATALFVPVYFGRRKPGYSHMRHTISELGEIGSPVGASVSYIGFVAIGVLVWLFIAAAAAVVPHGSKEALYLLAFVGVGYVAGGIFRCDAGAPPAGSWRTSLHNIFGALEYVGAAGAFSTLKSSEFWYPLSEFMTHGSVLMIICLLGVSFPHPFRGLVQRVAETFIFASVVVMGWWVYRASV